MKRMKNCTSVGLVGKPQKHFIILICQRDFACGNEALWTVGHVPPKHAFIIWCPEHMDWYSVVMICFSKFNLAIFIKGFNRNVRQLDLCAFRIIPIIYQCPINRWMPIRFPLPCDIYWCSAPCNTFDTRVATPKKSKLSLVSPATFILL